MIDIRNLSKHFGDLKAVDDLNLHIPQGEFFAFLGPNAAGKTTTIKLIAGLLRPTAGSCTVGGFDMQKQPEAAKALLSYVPDFPFLYDKLTPREFMQFVGDVFDMDPRVAAKKADQLFEQFHLDSYRNELTENLSHGTRQRLAIASALLHDPKIFIIDEPMVGLDPAHARIVKDELKARSQNGMTVFLSTHTLTVAEEIADRIGIINRGRLVALGTVEELRAQTTAGGALEKVFLAIVDAEESQRQTLRPIAAAAAADSSGFAEK
ncbi:MAG: ABC transporter ATP-binding protein [Verrucomicrobiota bacterium]|nr:ABC transporter ATP-binding protein [Verrucomicrobiota bacterium]